MLRALMILVAMTSLVVLDSHSPSERGESGLMCVAIVKASTHCDTLKQVSLGYVNCNASKANNFFISKWLIRGALGALGAPKNFQFFGF